MRKQAYSKLATALREAGYTGYEAARELRITPQTYSAKIQGKHPWTLDEMYALLGLMGVSPAAMHVYFPERRRISA